MPRSDTGAPLSLYAYPSDNVAGSAASVTSATEYAPYEALRLVDTNPGRPYKSSTDAATVVFTFSSPVALKAIAACNHNLAGRTGTLTNNNGLSSVSLVFPSNDADGLCVNAWARFDDQSASVRSATVWTLTIPSGALNPAIGEILLLTEIREFRFRWGLKFKPRHLVSKPGTTFGGRHLKYDKQIRIWEFIGMVSLAEDEDSIRDLAISAKGIYHHWFFAPDEDVNEWWFVEWEEDAWETVIANVELRDMPVRGREVSSGPPLFA